MYRILTASKDTYITDKILNNKFRVTDTNVGKAASLDLFKLYGESISGSDTSPLEISRILVDFDLKPLRDLTSSILDYSDNSFNCTLKLFDIYGGQTTPADFKIIVFPLSRSFDEGNGIDVVRYQDLGSSNFITSSVSSGSPVKWFKSGANKQGLLNSDDIDIISSGTIKGKGSDGVVSLFKTQTFANGDEDLSVDVTNIVSATLAGLIPDKGFRISYSGTQETDGFTRFVKRFASTQHSEYSKRPRIEVKFNDSVQDHHEAFYFNISGSIFLNNFHRGVYSSILSGAAASQITGANSLILKLESGSTSRGTYFSKIITASAHKRGINYISGVYSASFALSEFSSSNRGEIRTKTSQSYYGSGSIDSLENEIRNAGSATFTEIWGSLDGTVGFLTSSFVISSVNRTSFNNQNKRLLCSITNMKNEYRHSDVVRFRVFIEDIDRPVKSSKVPLETKSQIFTSLYYRIRDAESGKIIIPFDSSTSLGTLCSCDSEGMYFDVYMSSLFKGKLYTIDLLLKDRSIDQVFTDIAAKFRII
tara:strand:+ start:535 stop:2139 length:1605 start_codon:yes stop_codon:yes gene_type:complete